MPSKRRTIADALRRAVLDFEGTQAELARRCGVTPASIHGFANGRHFVSEELLNRLADELGLELVVKTKRGRA
jgi:transcriptional regulator with XRE-family HTH domain